MGDPLWHDPVMAGWWAWGQSCWIGGGWASGAGPWIVGADGRIEKRSGTGSGVSRRLPHLGSNGNGVNHAGTREPGVGEEPEFHPMTMPELRRWFRFLSARLRHVRILNGDWQRACTGGALKTFTVRQGKGPAGVFLDPPYGTGAERDKNIYACDDLNVATAVCDWCIANGDDKQLRIVLAGFAGEGHERLEAAGWTVAEWYRAGFLKGGMANHGTTGTNQHKERLWLSPHCLRPGTKQLGLF